MGDLGEFVADLCYMLWKWPENAEFSVLCFCVVLTSRYIIE